VVQSCVVLALLWTLAYALRRARIYVRI
jgi:hypothetical protein